MPDAGFNGGKTDACELIHIYSVSSDGLQKKVRWKKVKKPLIKKEIIANFTSLG